MNKFSEMVSEELSVGGVQKIGLDVHGVIDSLPQFFAFLTDSFVKNGGEVHIITGGHWDEKFNKQLEEFGIKWTHKFSVYDYLIESGCETIGQHEFSDGTIQKKFPNSIWDSVKAKYCKENGISLHIDDTLIYNNFFSTPFCRLWSHTNTPKASEKDIRHLD